MSDIKIEVALSEDELNDLLAEFFDEHEREPYSNHDFSRWLAEGQVRCAEQIQYQLKIKGLMVTSDGKIVRNSE